MNSYLKELTYSLFLGCLITLTIISFTIVVKGGTHLLWETMPSWLGHPTIWPLIIGMGGGLVVGLLQKFVGPYPKNIKETMQLTKQASFYQGQIWRNLLNAIVILIFGAGVGPEAALVAIGVGMSGWLSDRLKYSETDSDYWANTSMSTALALVFTNPFFGLSEQVVHDPHHHRPLRRFSIYFATLAVAWELFSWLSHLVGTPFFHLRFHALTYPANWVLTALIAFILAEIFSLSYHGLIKPLARLNQLDAPVRLALLGGLILGLSGMWSSYLLFSGEDSLPDLLTEFSSLSAGFLLLLGSLKMVLAIFYNAVGWRGGDIFPNIFGSICFGLGIASLLHLAPVIVATIFCAVTLTNIMKKPLIVCGLLLLVFPLSLFPLIVLGSSMTAAVTWGVDKAKDW
ncbi:chloride channel protein [Levilactobacillus bambusae]|uniref:Chloride channel protein n=1 Tax=Levilactobacillus bambusae TaxID=2024736 RepID=A0A2V1MZY1_9LACO|nr:chloride channel protein [Levilactobacillus bambusae]PWF99724.1 hypothetical protein DCM90_06600 [Levilactobacillus bambusae]